MTFELRCRCLFEDEKMLCMSRYILYYSRYTKLTLSIGISTFCMYEFDVYLLSLPKSHTVTHYPLSHNRFCMNVCEVVIFVVDHNTTTKSQWRLAVALLC